MSSTEANIERLEYGVDDEPFGHPVPAEAQTGERDDAFEEEFERELRYAQGPSFNDF